MATDPNKIKNPQVGSKMKTPNLLWIVLIGLTLVISSCGKKEEISDDDDSSCVTSTTASGSITVGSETFSGVYAAECITEDLPELLKGIKFVYVVTGDSTFSEEIHLYDDTSCSTVSGYWKNGRASVTVGAASGSYYRVDYTKSTIKLLANTTTAESILEGVFGGNVNLTVGEEYSLSDSGEARKNLIYVTSNTVKLGDDSSSDYPSDVSDGPPEAKKTCQ